MLVLLPPVEAPPTRAFHYERPFAARQHRGLDFPTRPGTRVIAPCSGRVTFTGTLPAGQALTLRCQSFNVTLLGVATHKRQAKRGHTIGHATATELHLGVRRTSDRLGYIDPAPLLRRPGPPQAGPPPAAVRRRPLPPHVARPRLTAPPAATTIAPWPVWLGLTCLLAATGGAARRRHGRRRLEPTTRRGASPAAQGRIP